MTRRPVIAGFFLLATLAVVPAVLSTSAAARDSKTTCRGLEATIIGTYGRDVLIGTPGPDVIVGLEGNDTIRGHEGDDVICAGRHDDRLHGGKGDDRIYGQGNRIAHYWGDRFYDGPGDDFMHGGNDSGYDYVYYDRAKSGVVVDRAAGTIIGDSSGNDTIKLIGAIRGSRHDDVMTNNDQTCEFAGKGGDDVIVTAGECYLAGGAGNDIVTGGAGQDFILTSTGVDSLYGNGGDDYLYGGRGLDAGDGGSGVDTCTKIEEQVDCEESPALAPEDGSSADVDNPSRKWLAASRAHVRTG